MKLKQEEKYGKTIRRAIELYNLRQSGLTLEEVGARFGISRERVRQILKLYYRSTELEKLLNTAKVSKITDIGYGTVLKLHKHGLIKPVRTSSGGRHFWDNSTVDTLLDWKIHKSPKFVELTCYECGKKFSRRRYVHDGNKSKKYKHIFCSRHCLGKYLGRKFGFPTQPPRKKYDYEKIFELVRKGHKPSEIARELGVGSCYIYVILRKGGYVGSHTRKKMELSRKQIIQI